MIIDDLRERFGPKFVSLWFLDWRGALVLIVLLGLESVFWQGIGSWYPIHVLVNVALDYGILIFAIDSLLQWRTADASADDAEGVQDDD